MPSSEAFRRLTIPIVVGPFREPTRTASVCDPAAVSVCLPAAAASCVDAAAASVDAAAGVSSVVSAAPVSCAAVVEAMTVVSDAAASFAVFPAEAPAPQAESAMGQLPLPYFLRKRLRRRRKARWS